MADLNTTVGFTYSGTGLKQAQADLKRTSTEGKNAAQSLDMVENELRQTSQAAAVASQKVGLGARALRTLGISAGQAKAGLGMVPLQLQDIMVQLEMGVPITRTLGQQLPQLAGAFGGLAGAIGLAVGAAFSFAPLLFDIGNEADDTGKKVKSLKDIFDELRESTEEAKLELYRLAQGLETVAQARAKQAIEQLKAERETLRGQLAEGMEQGSRMRGGERRSLRDRIAELTEQINKETSALQENIRETNRAKVANDALNASKSASPMLRSGTRGIAGREGFGVAGSESIAVANARIAERIKAEEEGQKLSKKLYDKDVEEFRKAQAEKQKYADRAADSISSGFENAFTSIVNGTMSVSDAFRNMAASILNDLAKIVVRKSITDPLGGALSDMIRGVDFGSFFRSSGSGFGPQLSAGTASSLGFRASGGPVMSGSPYIVGERGPELFVPKASGSIVPNNAMGGQTVNINIVNENGGKVETQQNGPDIDVIIRRSVAADIAGGGSTFQAIRKTFELTPALNRRG